MFEKLGVGSILHVLTCIAIGVLGTELYRDREQVETESRPGCKCGPQCPCPVVIPTPNTLPAFLPAPEGRGGVIEERVIHLPEDGARWHLTLFVHEDFARRPEEARLVTWFNADKRLSSLKAQAHYHEYGPENPHYKARFATQVAAWPTVLLQRADGFIVFKASGVNIPSDPVTLGNMIADCCPRPQPQPQPQPNPFTPQPNPDGTPVFPDTVPFVPDDVFPPDARPANQEDNWVSLIVGGILGLLGQGVVNLKRNL